MGSTTRGSISSKGQMFLLSTTSVSGLSPFQPPLYIDTGCSLTGKYVWPGNRKWRMGRSAPTRYYLRSERKITMASTCRMNSVRKMCGDCFYAYVANKETHIDNICFISYYNLRTCSANVTISVVREYEQCTDIKITLKMYEHLHKVGPVAQSVQRLATGLDGPGIESRLGRDFPYLFRPALGPTQPPVQWVPVSRGHSRPVTGLLYLHLVSRIGMTGPVPLLSLCAFLALRGTAHNHPAHSAALHVFISGNHVF
jgi:hypothetical protein